MKRTLIERLTFLLFFVTLLKNYAQSATIIISSQSQSDKNQSNKSTQNSTGAYQVQIVKNFLNCAEIYNNECVLCQANYFLNTDKKCSQVSQLCQLFNLDEGICISCYNNATIIDGICYSAGQQPKINNHCMIWSDKQCLKCQKAFYLQEGTCKGVDIDFQCRNWDNNGKCLLCNPGYQLTQQKCVKSSNFIACSSNQYLSKDNKCSNPPQNCMTWDPFNSKCVKCIKNYDFKDWKCILPGKNNITVPQTKVIDNCVKMNTDNTFCLQCNQSFTLNSQKNICQQQIIKCRNYADSGQCISCIENQEIDQTLCQLKSNLITLPELYGCSIINLTSGKCYQCQSNFLPNDQGYCVLNEDHCLTRTFQTDICSICDDGYKIALGSCQIISQREIQNKTGCKLFDWVNNVCLICEDQFIRLDNGVCQKSILNCVTQKETKCIQCLPNYDLQDGKCTPFSVSKCIEFDDSHACKKCQDSFALIEGKCNTLKQMGTLLLDYVQFSPQKLKEKILIFTDKINI